MKKQILTLLIAAICFTANAQDYKLLNEAPNMNQSAVCNANTVVDSSFEAGKSSGAWTETSTNFGTPLCTVSFCGFGNGTGPNTGTWWAWFGGINLNEEGSVSQSVVLQANTTANLYFYLEVPTCETTGFVDFMAVIIDNTDTLFKVTNTSPLCGVQSYALQSINLDAYSDGSAHNILFYGHTFSSTNFFIDDVSVITCPISTGIQSVYAEPLISISPNPVKDKLKISFRNLPVTPAKIDIINLIGQSVYNHTLSLASMDQDDFYIHVAGLLEEGIYFVILTSGEKIFTQRLIVH